MIAHNPAPRTNTSADFPVPDLRAAAIAYARRGWEVFPLRTADKAPATKHGLLDATADVDTVTRWWDRNPLLNIGIRPPDSVIVLDIDPRNGGDIDALGAYPDTWTARTGGGGWHLWFRYDGRAMGKLRDIPGIDIKTRSGYVVAPPSIHPSGRRYTWQNRTPVANLPLPLIEQVEPPRRRQNRAVVLEHIFDDFLREGGDELVRFLEEMAQEGNRNNALYWCAMQAYQNHPGHDELIDALGNAALTIGLPAYEVANTIRSAKRKANAQ